MLAPHPAAWRPAARGLATLASLHWLSGCAESRNADGGIWWFASVALLLAAVGAFVLGRTLERQRQRQDLLQARSALQRLEALQASWRWRTDAGHQLLSWQGPGMAPQRQSALFEATATAEALMNQLRSRRAFGQLRLELPTPQDGARGWLLAGVPRLDDGGNFDGFDGQAEPTDEADACQASAAGVDLLLAECGNAALLALLGTDGWRVVKANAAAQARWPTLQPGAALAEALAAAPTGVIQAWDGLRPGEAQDVQGWRVAAYATPADGRRGLLIKPPGVAGAAPATPEADNFSFTVSHDLRAPIRVVEGFTRIVKEDYGRQLDRVGNDHLDRVLGAAARMNQMIDALLTLAKLSQQPLSRQPVNLSQLAGFVVDDLRRSAPERPADIDIEPGLYAQGDPTLLRMVLENLLGNAWKYSARVLRAQISLQRAPHGAGWAYVVRDNGTGFDMRSSDRLFGLFQRLHSASEFPGTGVGLASVRRIVQRHGGEIWAEAEVGRGAAFFFTLAD
jgi:signal transduction histidine kinase